MRRGDSEGTLMKKEIDVQGDRGGMRLSSNGESKTGVWICGEPKPLGERTRLLGSGGCKLCTGTCCSAVLACA